MKQSFKQYRVLRPIAEGGMATIVAARVTGIDAPVAVKVLHKHLAAIPEFVAMFRQEAQLAEQLRHPNLVRTYGACFDDPRPFLVMELVTGPNLSQILTQLSRPLPASLALRIYLDVLSGLHAAHELKTANGERIELVHSDVTPHNILIDRNGRCKLSDFGVAQNTAYPLPASRGLVAGKLAYLAPEQLTGHGFDQRADVYTCGVSLWETLAGQRPFTAPRAELVARAIERGKRRPLTALALNVPEALSACVERALSVDPAERYATAEAFSAALRQAAKQGSLRAASAQELSAFLHAHDCFDSSVSQTPLTVGESEAARASTAPHMPPPPTRDELRDCLRQLWQLEQDAPPED